MAQGLRDNNDLIQLVENLRTFARDAHTQETNELRTWLLKDIESSLQRFTKNWNQCNKMTKLDYNALDEKIEEISKCENRYFYIGYTGELKNYLWTTTPKSSKVTNDMSLKNLVKKHTYYTRLGNVAEQSEATLIKKFINKERRLNSAGHGKSDTTGIVYVLEYGPKGN